MRVDLERLREKARHLEWVRVERDELAALVTVVDAARCTYHISGLDGHALLEPALKPFTPPDRAWEEVDRWNARTLGDPAITFGPDGKARFGNPRDRARDQLADAGVVVQRQFRSDQERIAELEANAVQAHYQTHEVAALRERIAELEARLARVPALVETVRRFVDADGDYSSLVAALAEWEKP